VPNREVVAGAFELGPDAPKPGEAALIRKVPDRCPCNVRFCATEQTYCSIVQRRNLIVRAGLPSYQHSAPKYSK
jgi:hypothetical protein